jgi:ACDE family multidrug resistance protein
MAKDSLYRDRNLQIVFGVTLMSVLGVSSITPAFPTITHELGITGGQVGLLITFFTLPGVILAPVLGVLADRFGRKKILVPSLFLFAIAGTACTFIRDFNFLLGMRAIQGIGAASLGSINATIIGDLYSGGRRVEAMGLNASVLSIGTASYPAIGGALALLGWNYPFVLSIIAVPVGILVLTSLKNPEPTRPQNLRDYLSGTWKHLKDIRVAGLFAAGMLTFVILYGACLTYFTLLMGESFNASSFIIGIIVASMSLTTAAVAWQLGKINRWLSIQNIIKLAFVVYALALILIPLMPSLWLLLIPAIIFGIAHGAIIPSIQTSVAGLAPIEYRAAFMSLNSTMLRLGQTIGPPLMGLIYAYRGFDATFFAAAGLALLAPLVAVVFGKIKPSKVNNIPSV